MNPPILLTTLLMATALPALGQTFWTGNDTTSPTLWNRSANWSNLVPNGSSRQARFSTDTAATIQVPGGSATAGMSVQGNASVTLQLQPGTFNISAQTNVGHAVDGSASLTLEAASAATVSMSSFMLGITASGGNRLTFRGPLTVDQTSTAGSGIGRNGSAGNRLSILEGADVSQNYIYVGNRQFEDPGYRGNEIVVDGAGSRLHVSSPTSNLLLIGSLGALNTSGYANALQNNSLQISNGGRVIASTSAELPANVMVGSIRYAHSNFIRISGEQSSLTLNGGAGLTVGDEGVGQNLGGNFVEIRDGGALLSDTEGTITIHSHERSASQNAGENRLMIGGEGTLAIAGDVRIDGVLTVDREGSFTARSVSVSAGGRAELAGDHYLASGGTVIAGTLALSDSTGSTPSTLRVQSSLALTGASSVIELRLFGDQLSDQITLDAGGSLSISESTALQLLLEDDYLPELGATWSFFNGATDQVVGEFGAFILPELGHGYQWDTTTLNAAGGWQATVIPEGNLYGLCLIALGWGCVASRQRRLRAA